MNETLDKRTIYNNYGRDPETLCENQPYQCAFITFLVKKEAVHLMWVLATGQRPTALNLLVAACCCVKISNHITIRITPANRDSGNMDHTNDNERTPLVGSGPPNRDPSPDSLATIGGVTWRRNIWYIAILVLTAIASSLSGPPYVRLLESVICKNYYFKNDPAVIGHDGSIPEDYCKEKSIQGHMALIQTIQQALNFVAGKLYTSLWYIV
jgi:hypothetical protein